VVPVKVALLAGGTGGAKLAAGMQEVLGADLAVIANTADDTRVHGLYVSPDPDLITYWLAGAIDEERGWGIREDSFVVHERLEQLGAPGWFGLSDRDLATCLYRTHFMAEGGTLTAAQGQIARALAVTARVLPMSEEPVYTRVLTPNGWRGLQEFLIVDGSAPEIEGVEVQGLPQARPTPEVLEALSGADAIIVGPSNPVISIGPILAVPGMREAIAASGVPVLAVSPFVAGHALKGPTEKFMAALGRPSTAAGVASLYEGVIQAMVVDADDPDPGPDDVQVFSCPTLMEGREGRREVAERVLEFAEVLG
jgi:LPPG:FO 2-phospho-L-lactate transferase